MRNPDEFSRYYAELIEGSYDCVDRIVVNAYFSMGQTGGGLRTWWRDLYGNDANLDDEHLRRMAGDFSRRVHAYCKERGIPLIKTMSGERKHEIAEEHLPKDPDFRGLFLVLTGNAPAPVWEVIHNKNGKIGDIRSRKHWPYIQHYFFHLIDAEWGHVTVRMCGYPPFGAQVILNGHEWVGRQALRDHVMVAKESNCFVAGSDFEAIGQLAAALNEDITEGGLKKLCERWITTACLCFALSLEEQQRSGFTYAYSVYQIELSRNFLFRSGRTMDEVYQNLIDRTRRPMNVERLKTIFGHARRPPRRKTRGQEDANLGKSVTSNSHDLTVLKITWGRLALKIYDKGERVLRVEVVVHNAKDLRCGKVLDKLPEMLERMNGMLVRFLEMVQVIHVSFLDEGAFDQWSDPSIRGTRRLAGIDLNKARNRHVLDAVVELSTQPDGFTAAQLAEGVRQRSKCNVDTYSTRQAIYDLAKLRGKNLIQRIGRSRRYEACPEGIRAMCAYLLLREKVIKPLLAGVAHKPDLPPKDPSPIDQHYIALRLELLRTFATLGLVA